MTDTKRKGNADLWAQDKYLQDDILAPWISRENIPDILQEFDKARDPDLYQMREYNQKSEKERREESAALGYFIPLNKDKDQRKPGSRMIQQDQPRHDNRPPREMREEADRARFNTAWLRERHDHVMRQSRPDPQIDHPDYERQPNRYER